MQKHSAEQFAKGFYKWYIKAFRAGASPAQDKADEFARYTTENLRQKMSAEEGEDYILKAQDLPAEWSADIKVLKDKFNTRRDEGTMNISLGAVGHNALDKRVLQINLVRKDGLWRLDDVILFDAGDGENGEVKTENSGGTKTEIVRSEIENGDDFFFITINGKAVEEATKPCRKSLRECGADKIPLYSKENPDRTNTDKFREETFEFGGKKGVYLLTKQNYKTGAEIGERLRIEFEKKGDVWVLTEGGKQFLCDAGANAGRWTNQFCG